ncbi:serine/threonine protein kinase [Streptomyces sp. NPDC001832]|uniref:serine/threonine protein kinase n=1 Tax=Streptomyces sp. NPDC001832 TaxID=3154527 RepID=UPI00331918D8
MDDYAGRVLADRYRLPLPPSDEYELVETRAFDTYSGQEVLVRQVPLPEVVDAEVLDADGPAPAARRATGHAVRRATDPAVQRAIEAAQAAAQVPDHPRLDQVFDVFAEAGSLWIVSELVMARPLAALLAECPLNPFRAAEIGSDVLTALRALHVHGWTHRNITVRTVLVCDDGRVVLTGLAAGAAEEALCGYAPTPQPDGEDDDGYGGDGQSPPGRRLPLTGTWSDGPGSGHPVPAGGSDEDTLRADARGHGNSPALPAHRPEPQQQPGSWDESVASGRTGPAYRGPATTLAAERARQTRIAVVGAVTERWAPEQAGPVHENWQLAPPIGPATDLWALGALLYRAVQGHAPYPEENAAELVEMVCGEPPAFAEECGPLRPVVESLLRQDPTERPDVEELRGWLRSLVRSAPEPEAGLDVVSLPSLDSARLPVVRRRGELVRRRRGLMGQGAARGRHRHTKERPDRHDSPRAERAPRAPREPKGPKALRTPPPRPQQGEGRAPRRLGRLLLVLILLALVAAIAYAAMFMPKADSDSGTRSSGPASSTSASPEPGAGASGEQSPAQPSGAQRPQTSRSAVALAPGYALRKDPEGFEVGVLKGWQRSPVNADRQIRYGSDGFSLLIVPGRDTVKAHGNDPLAYQADKELELQPFRDSSWSGSSGLRRIDVGRQAMAEGQFTWQDANGREVYARNLAMIVDGRYHILQVIGPEDRRDKVSDIYEQAVASYRVTP